MESHYFSSEILEWVSSFPSYDMHDWVGQVRARRATIFARILTLSLSFLGGEGGGCSDAPKGLTVSEVVVEDGDRGVTEKAAAAALLAHTLYILTPLLRQILCRERLKKPSVHGKYFEMRKNVYREFPVPVRHTLASVSSTYPCQSVSWSVSWSHFRISNLWSHRGWCTRDDAPGMMQKNVKVYFWAQKNWRKKVRLRDKKDCNKNVMNLVTK